MSIISDEMILYGGLIIAGASVLLGVVYSVIHMFRKRKLKSKFDAEYGEAVKMK